MAQKVKIILEDDLEGGSADETVRFGLDGGQYEIDLSTENAAKLRDLLRPYQNKARRVQSRGTRTGNNKSTGAQSRNPETSQIRQWAKENGYDVSDRGRIHQSIQDAYYAAKKDGK